MNKLNQKIIFHLSKINASAFITHPIQTSHVLQEEDITDNSQKST